MADRRADMYLPPEADTRTEPPTRGGERATLAGFLRWQRQTFELKCAELSPEQLARRAVEPSTLSLLGLLRHLADVELRWFRLAMAGQDAPVRFVTLQDGEFTGAVADPEVVAEAWSAWREEVAFAERFVAEAADLDVVSASEDAWRGRISLRWVLTHMIEEYARHNGHADLLRERIDGRLGQ